MSDSLWPQGLNSPWNSPGQNTGMSSLFLLQGILPTQGLNPGFPHHRRILYQLSHKGSPRILAWVAYPFSSGSSWPRNRTGVSCTASGFFTNWAIREALEFVRADYKKICVVFLKYFEIYGWRSENFYICRWNYKVVQLLWRHFGNKEHVIPFDL